MGLLLSILVTCVGVVELLAFYHNVKRRVHYQPVQTTLTSVRDKYLKELEGVRDELENQLEHLKKQQNTPNTRPNIPTLRLNSHEDIEIEFNDKAVTKSRSPSPRRFLVSEKQLADPTPTRQFVVSEEPQALQGIKKSKAQECLPEYLIEEKKQPGIPRYVLKDNEGPVPLPLPDKFLVSERGESKSDVFRKKLGHNVVEVDGELYYRRSPSPFPSFDLTAPRNSICSELLDDSARVCEVDETSRSNSHSPVIELSNYREINNNSEKMGVIINASISSHSSTDFWEHKALVIHPSKSRSPSPKVAKQSRRRSLSESNMNLNIQPVHKTLSSLEFNNDELNSSDDDEFMDVEGYSEEMKNNLDGLDGKKGCIKKKYVKRKRIKNRPDDDNKLGPSKSNEIISPQSKNPTGAKPGEPFWVNR